MKRPKVLIVGAKGQLGVVLTRYLQDRYGFDQVIASDLHETPFLIESKYEKLDATDQHAVLEVVVKHGITHIYHMAAILSAKGEEKPIVAWELNMKTLINILEVARISKVKRVFYPSSIAVYGGEYDRTNTDNDTPLTPSTVYGISKVAGENWANYYYQKYNLDVRSLRYPGVIGYQSMPSGGTTDYAVEIFHRALVDRAYTCYLSEDTKLPMIFIDDAIRATVEIMEAPQDKITRRTSYNLAGISFTPATLATAIQKEIPDFNINYQPDFRQQIADQWPQVINDKKAQEDWNWKPAYDLPRMVAVMLSELQKEFTSKTTLD
ncbi:NAD-dependent epimerase/dehydratase family protein [Aquimarina sp. ERC-38]|uniref:NAD-dependent epimerase/dehydratase family protein n=1 Tax=Aquimarina sp. ERC-38 TaxID=2949996 RepID=UPI0022481BC4|nr:NAD-dependent epimerase/dehydratase family protein [Aquimarina sp. ERC-38]UZO80982.1 NAD-dependent epimerase/dehydratase family protein [Aquimarina sp. ERC-38]